MKATVLEIVEVLLRFGPGTREAIESRLEMFKGSVDRERVSDEIMFLNIFTVDYAVSTAIPGRAKKEILDAYYARLQEIAKQNANKEHELFVKLLKNRLLAYTDAVKTPHQNGPIWTVGKKFSQLCGCGMNIKVILIGSNLFSATLQAVTGLVAGIEIAS